MLAFLSTFLEKVGKNRQPSRIARFSGTKCRYHPSLKRKWGARSFGLTSFLFMEALPSNANVNYSPFTIHYSLASNRTKSC